MRRRAVALGRGTLVGFAVAVLLLVAMGVGARVELRAMGAAGDRSRQSLDVLRQIDVLLGTVLEAETGQRGYILTGSREYLDPYKAAAQRVQAETTSLRELTLGDAVHQARVDRLQPLIESKMTEIESTIHLRSIQGPEAALEVVRTGYGKQLMDDIRASLAAMYEDERQRLQEQVVARDRRSERTSVFIVLCSLLASAIILTSTLALNSHARERLRAEADLRETNERLRVTLRSIGDAVIATDPHGRIVFANPVAEALTGWREDEARGRPLHEVFAIVDEETRERVESPVARVVRLGSVVGLANHTVLLARDGRETAIDDSGAPIRGPGGDLMGVVLVFRDISERRRAAVERELALRAEVEKEATARALARSESSLALLETIFDTAPIGLGFFDADLRFVRLNRTLAEIDGRPAEEKIGRRLSDLIRAADPAVISDLEQATRDGTAVVGAEVRGESSATPGTTRTWQVSYVPVHNQLGGRLGTAAVVAEVTDRKRAEEDLAGLLRIADQARAEAEEANRAKDEFLAIVSHELRSPLAAMAGWIRILADRCEGDAIVDQAVRTLQRNVGVQTRIISDLLDVSRSVSGKLQVEMRVVDLAALVESSVEATRPVAVEREVGMRLQIDAPGPLLVRGDSGRLIQVFLNLLNNALKFTPPGGEVAVSIAASDERVRTRVRDTGRGIDPAFLPHVFERFRQSENPNTREYGGLGLGLSIVKSLVDLHGGSVSADSAGAGRGATFTVDLPLAVGEIAAEPMATAGAADAAGVGLSGLHVLLVEDDEDTRLALRLLLEDEGIVVVAVGSMAAALESYARRLPDLILSDIGLPGGSGYELLRRVRELDEPAGRRTLAVAMTGFASKQDHEAALRAGFDEHLQKPVDVDVLLERLRVLAAALPGRSIV